MGLSFLERGSKLLVAVVLSAIATSACSPEVGASSVDVRAVASKSTDFQRKILEDGAVSATEYEQAVLASRDCIKAAGGEVGDVEPQPGNQLGFETTVTAQDETVSKRVGEAIGACNREYLFDVAKVWSYQEMLSPKDKEAIRPRVIECLNQTGLNIDSNAKAEAIQNAIEAASGKDQRDAVTRCIQDYPEFFQSAPGD